MREKAKGELAYKPLLNWKDEGAFEFHPQFFSDCLPPQDSSITLLIEQFPITTDIKRKIPPLNIVVIDERGEQTSLAECIANVSVVQPCIVAPDWDYELYLKSKEWEQRRQEYFSKNGYKCNVCGSQHIIQLHHLNYNRLGYEKDSDLICLCSECHKLLHIYKDQYLERIGDLARMWFYPTRNIEGANTNGDLINRFITKHKAQLDYVFCGLPPIIGRAKTKFASELLSSMRSRHENKLLPFHMIVKLIKSK